MRDGRSLVTRCAIAIVAWRSYLKRMTPQELKAYRKRLGWSREELARRLDVSPSRLMDYELGHTRTATPRPAPIPIVVELACRWLEAHARPLTPEEKAARWRDTRHLPQHTGPRLDVSRAALYR